jgi:hypothetical protein
MAPQSPKPERIESLEQLQTQIAQIVDRVNQVPGLLCAAAANPLLALEELGFELDPGVASEIAERARFSLADIKRRIRLRDKIFADAGREFDLTSSSELREVIAAATRVDVSEIEVTLPYALRLQAIAGSVLRASREPAQDTALADPLEKFRGVHPLIGSLLEYRRIEAHAPRFCSPQMYKRLRSGSVQLPILSMRARLKRKPLA